MQNETLNPVSHSATYVAAVDMGTNSFHMIVAEIISKGVFRVIDREKHWVRLGDGLGKNGKLDQAAIERMLDSLGKCKRLAESYNAPLHCIATSALRDAGNRVAILNRIRKTLDLEIDIVSGQEEARLIFQGVRSEGHVGKEPVLVIDIGGGSTEVVVGNRDEVLVAESMNMGARRYAREFFESGKYLKRDISLCEHAAASKIQSIAAEYDEWNGVEAVGTSGTIRALAELCVHFGESDSATTLRLKHLKSILPQLIEASRKKEQIANLEKERADTIVAGTIILQEIMQALAIKKLTISPSALREGIVFDRAEELGALAVRPMQTSVQAMVGRFDVDRAQIHRVRSTAMWIFSSYAKTLDLDFEAHELLYAACSLHEIGLSISHSRMHLHGAYIVEHADLTGVTWRQQQMLAAIVRFHRKARPGKNTAVLNRMTRHDADVVSKLAAILRLAAAMNRTQSGKPCLPYAVAAGKGWEWVVDAEWAEQHEICLWNAGKEKPPLEKWLKGKVVFRRERDGENG